MREFLLKLIPEVASLLLPPSLVQRYRHIYMLSNLKFYQENNEFSAIFLDGNNR